MRKLLLLAPLLLIAGCSGRPILTCDVDFDSRDFFKNRRIYLQETVPARPTNAGYGRLYLYGKPPGGGQEVELPYLHYTRSAKLSDGRLLLMSCWEQDPEPSYD